jgi:hypothetical protein
VTPALRCDVARRAVGSIEFSAPRRWKTSRQRATNPNLYDGIFKETWEHIEGKLTAGISGHLTRVGATQDLAALDIDLAAITQAGGWKSTRMPQQYAEKINAARSGMARAAEKAGRDSITVERSARWSRTSARGIWVQARVVKNDADPDTFGDEELIHCEEVVGLAKSSS